MRVVFDIFKADVLLKPLCRVVSYVFLKKNKFVMETGRG